MAVALTACGGSDESIPGNAVAKVGEDAIKKEVFDHWMKVAAISSAGSAEPDKAGASASVPDAPDFKQCIEEKKKSAPKPAKGQPKPTDDTFKSQCQQQYDGLKQQVMQFLISSEWIQGEAKEQKVEVTDKEVDKQFETTKKQSFPKEADFQKFLKTSGMTLEDIKFRVKLDGGASFKDIAKQYSIDQASKNQGGVLLAVAKGQQEKALDTAIFAADKGKLVGPVKTQFGYYVFEVTKITKATQQTLDQAKATIKQTLASQNQQKALDSFVKSFRKRWKAKTDCRDAYATQDCKNAPKATPTPSATAPATQTVQPTATPTPKN